MNLIFHTRLKALRTEKKKTQEEMAKELQIKRSTYGEYERGKIMPPVDKIEVLARVLETTPQYLLGWDKSTEATQEDMSLLGEVVRILREKRNVSAEEFARDVGISEEELEHYETGVRRIPARLMYIIADYFDMTPEALFGSQMITEGLRTVYVSEHKVLLERIKMWNKVFGDFVFEKDEIEKLIIYAKFLLYLREEDKQ